MSTNGQQKNGQAGPHCRECGCRCDNCCPASKVTTDNVVVHLYTEIEKLKRQISERDYHIVQMETAVMKHAKEFPNGELGAMEETLRFWQEKHERLLESHKKLQRVNQALEDKLLRLVDRYEGEKSALTRDLQDMAGRLADARAVMADLEEENDAYKSDCSVAVQLLQCKPSNFVAHRTSTLPSDIQEKVRNHFMNASSGRRTKNQSNGNNGAENGTAKIIRVPIPTFPPTAMVYSVNGSNDGKTSSSSSTSSNNSTNNNTAPDHVSAAILAKVLEERFKERSLKTGTRYQKCFQCRVRRVSRAYFDISTQTPASKVTSDDLRPLNALLYWGDEDEGTGGRRRSRNESSSSATSSESFVGNTTNISGGGGGGVGGFGGIFSGVLDGVTSQGLKKKSNETIII